MRDDSSSLHRCVRPLAAAILIAAVACSDSTGPRYVRSTFSASRGVASVWPGVRVAGQMITVGGDMTTPVPCFALSGITVMEGTTLVVRVIARPEPASGADCALMEQPWLYTVTIPAAPTSIRAIRVIEHVASDHVVLDQPLTVP